MSSNDDKSKYELLIELEKQRAKTVTAGTRIPQITGLICVIGGIALAVLGLTGSTSILVEAEGFKANLVNASPGVLLFFVGFLTMYISIPKQRYITEFNKDYFMHSGNVEHGLVIDKSLISKKAEKGEMTQQILDNMKNKD